MLDPRRIGLNAADIGFQKRMHQDLDFNAIEAALQTDYNNQGSAVQVRRERDAAKDEIHIMGGELGGFQSNDLVKTLARQERQINGYPLRHFDAENPAVILPMKYGGFPLYNRNQTEYPDFVSTFTEPMSAPLQRDTELLSRMGKTPISNSLTRPFEEDGYINPMNKSYDQLQLNKDVFVQRKHLQKMSDRSNKNRGSDNGPRDNNNNNSGPNFNVPGGEKGIFINKNGDPMSTVQEQLSGQIVANNTFANNQINYLRRQAGFQNPANIDFNQDLMAGAGSLTQEQNDDHAMFTPSRLGMPSLAEMLDRDPIVNHDQNQHGFFYGEDNGYMLGYLDSNNIRSPTLQSRVAISTPNLTVNPTGSLGNGMQPMGLYRNLRGNVRMDIPSDSPVYSSRTPSRLQINATPHYKEGTPTVVFKSHKRQTMLSGVKGSNRTNEVLGNAAREARARRSSNLRRTNSKHVFKTPAGTTPFKQKIRTMDYGYRSIATPGTGTRYNI